jgi:hypothetical protein
MMIDFKCNKNSEFRRKRKEIIEKRIKKAEGRKMEVGSWKLEVGR